MMRICQPDTVGTEKVNDVFIGNLYKCFFHFRSQPPDLLESGRNNDKPLHAALAALLLALALAGCDNVQTPQGEVTYLYKRAKWYRAASLEGTQRGPTSTGWVWQMSAVSFDYLPNTYNEPF